MFQCAKSFLRKNTETLNYNKQRTTRKIMCKLYFMKFLKGNWDA